MASSTTSAAVPARRPLKNPLRIASVVPFPDQARDSAPEDPLPRPEPRLPGPKLRQMQISQFTQWLLNQVVGNLDKIISTLEAGDEDSGEAAGGAPRPALRGRRPAA